MSEVDQKPSDILYWAQYFGATIIGLFLFKYAVYIVYRKKVMKKTTVIAITSAYYVVITTIVYALLVATTFFEIDKALGEGANFIVDDNVKTMTYISQQVAETPCKSSCPPDAEMCITMCAQTAVLS